MPLYTPDPPGFVPVGGIILWSGTIALIPSSWQLCDGSNGTIDLRDKFVIGATQDNASVAKTNVEGSLTQSGGHAFHAHTASGSAVSTHTLSTNVAIDAHAGTAVNAHTLSTNVSVTASHATVASMASGTTRVGTPTTAVAVGVTQPAVAAHTVTQPNAHAITQPVVAAHSVTQPTIANSATGDALPPYFALAYMQRMS
jgi:hypothetical protein